MRVGRRPKGEEEIDIILVPAPSSQGGGWCLSDRLEIAWYPVNQPGSDWGEEPGCSEPGQGKMVTIFFANGESRAFAAAVSVKSGSFASVDVLACLDSEGRVVASFFVNQIAGYAIEQARQGED